MAYVLRQVEGDSRAAAEILGVSVRRENRIAWIREAPESVKRKLDAGEIDELDVLRRHGVILDWGSREVLPRTTAQFREMLERRTVAYWK